MVVKTIPRWVSCTSKLIDWTVPLLHCGVGARTLVLHEQVAPAGEQLPGQAAQAVRDALAHAPLHGAGVPRHKALPVRRPRAWRARARAHLPAAPPSSSCQAECSRSAGWSRTPAPRYGRADARSVARHVVGRDTQGAWRRGGDRPRQAHPAWRATSSGAAPPSCSRDARRPRARPGRCRRA